MRKEKVKASELFVGCRTREVNNPTWHICTLLAGEPHFRLCEIEQPYSDFKPLLKKQVKNITCPACIEKVMREEQYESVSDEDNPHGSCMDCEWAGPLKECDTEYDYDEFWGQDRPYPLCPECGGGVEW